MKDSIAENSYLTAEDLAKALSVSTRTIRRLRARGDIPCLMITPSRPRFKLDDVVKALERVQGVITESE